MVVDDPGQAAHRAGVDRDLPQLAEGPGRGFHDGDVAIVERHHEGADDVVVGRNAGRELGGAAPHRGSRIRHRRG